MTPIPAVTADPQVGVRVVLSIRLLVFISEAQEVLSASTAVHQAREGVASLIPPESTIHLDLDERLRTAIQQHSMSTEFIVRSEHHGVEKAVVDDAIIIHRDSTLYRASNRKA
jgi:hypothetical protein